jgi:formylglycine-generating enzyme required for sulfatase activity
MKPRCSAFPLSWLFALVTAGVALGAPAPLPAAESKVPVDGSSFTIAGLQLEMRPIPAGTFLMGSPADEPGYVAAKEGPQTRVTLTLSFWMGRTEITHGQWKRVMGTDLVEQARRALTNDTLFPYGSKQLTQRDAWKRKADDDPALLLNNTGDDLPMHLVDWNEAMEFGRRLTERERTAGRLRPGFVYTLPTEAQWEYAARAGSSGATYAGPIVILGRHNAPVLDAIAWYGGNSSVGYEGKGTDLTRLQDKQHDGTFAGQRTVATKQPNAWGLHDMLGSVWEWCLDNAGTYPGGEVIDFKGPDTDPRRAERGGSWRSYAAENRAAFRFFDLKGIRDDNLGFRIVLVRE